MGRPSGSYLLPIVAVVIAVITIAGACTLSGNSAEAPKGPPVPTPVPLSAWDELIKAAQQEGTLNIYGSDIGPATRPLREAFKERFGINLEFTAGRGTEVITRLVAERNAGLYVADLGHHGETLITTDIKPLAVTKPLPNLLVLPEVKNPQNWIGGKLPFLDKENHVFMFVALAIPQLVVNTDMVKEGELSSFLDVLNPKWKGKIVLSDPTIAGTSPNLLAALYKTFGKEKAMDAFDRLADQEPAITRDQRMMLEWVARGKYPIGLGQSMSLYSEFRRAQAPMKLVNTKEPRFISGGPGNVIVFTNASHPMATQLYVNWLLTKEGSSIWSKATEYASNRLDVTREGLDPDTIPRADDIFPDEEQMRLRLEMRKISADIFKRVLK